MFVALWVALGIAAVAGLIVWVILADRRRRKKLAAWAAANGWLAYDAAAELGWLAQFEAWGPGYGHRAFDGYRRRMGDAEVRIFQHQSRTKTKDSENIHNFCVCVLEAPYAAPNLRFKHEHWGHKLVDALGGEDIDFESHEFSRKFWVKCASRRFAYDAIHPRMMEFLLTAPKANWQWQGQRLVLFTGGSLKGERAAPLAKAGGQFLELLPKHLEPS